MIYVRFSYMYDVRGGQSSNRQLNFRFKMELSP